MSNSYNEVIYKSQAIPEIHLGHLSSIASLFGLAVPKLEGARVLELGSGTGGNLIPMAFSMPNTYFLGIDYASKQVEEGRKVIGDLNLKNIELKEQSILDFSGDAGKFDFIICNGVFSWVDDSVRRKILEIVKDHLSDLGLAYISYNVLPGWKHKGAIREMMRYHAADISDPKDKVEQGKALVKFLLDSQNLENSGYSKSLDETLKDLIIAPNYYIFHEYLEDNNKAFYFNEFVELIKNFKLDFVGEAHFSLMTAVDLPQSTQELLDTIDDRVRYEQYLDFIRNRKLRETIICHKNRKINFAAGSENFNSYYIAGNLEKVKFENGTAYYRTYNKGEIQTSNKLIILILDYLQKSYPRQIKFQDLVAKFKNESDIDFAGHLSQELFGFLSANLIELSLFDYQAGKIKDFPKVSDLARYQALKSEYVTSLRHQSVKLDSITRQVLSMLDGKTSIDDIKSKLFELYQKKEIIIDDQNLDIEKAKNLIAKLCVKSLGILEKKSFIIHPNVFTE